MAKSAYSVILENFISLIQRKMSEENWSQSEVAKRIGVSQPMVSMWLGGQRGQRMPYDTLANAYEALGGDMQSLIEDVLGKREAAVMFALKDRDPELFECLLRLSGSNPNSAEYQKFKSDVLYLTSRLEKNTV